jgi:hypothetical protein
MRSRLRRNGHEQTLAPPREAATSFRRDAASATPAANRGSSGRPNWRRSILAGTAIVLAVPLTASAASAAGQGARAASGPKPEIVVEGRDDPGKDVKNLNQAISQGADTGRTVRLVGHFDVGNDCLACVRITKPVTIVGTGDPTVASPQPNLTTVIEGGSRGGAIAPFAVNLPDTAPAGTVSISRLWFDKATLIQMAYIRTNKNTTINFAYNRGTGLVAARFGTGIFRFFVGAINPGGNGPRDRGLLKTQGRITIDHNYSNSLPRGFIFGDDNACGFARWEYDSVVLTNNSFASEGECEFEGGINPDATLVASGNRIEMNASLSPEGLLFLRPGHPTALKFIGNEARSITVRDNHIHAYGYRSGACMAVTNVITPAGAATTTNITGNTCDLGGTGAGFLGCSFAGTDLFYPQGELSNAVITGNTITGRAEFGIGFYNYAFPGLGVECASHGNSLRGNDLTGLRASRASLFFDRSTHDNVFVGSTGVGGVVDLGTNNLIITP